MQELQAANVNYYFGEVKKDNQSFCVKMIEAFGRQLRMLGATMATFDVTNPKLLKDVLIDCVASSVSTSIDAAGRPKVPRLELDPIVPDFATLPAIEVTAFTFKELPKIDEIPTWTKATVVETMKTLRIAPKPFANGTFRYAHHGQEVVGPGFPRNVILKKFIDPSSHPANDRSRYIIGLKIQIIAKALAEDYNNKLRASKIRPSSFVNFLDVALIEIKPDVRGPTRYMTLEQRFRGGKMRKYTNNGAFVISKPPEGMDADVFEDRCEMLLAYTHFTHQRTKGYLMVCDLQGVDAPVFDFVTAKVVVNMLLTDPAIHCKDHRAFAGNG